MMGYGDYSPEPATEPVAWVNASGSRVHLPVGAEDHSCAYLGEQGDERMGGTRFATSLEAETYLRQLAARATADGETVHWDADGRGWYSDRFVTEEELRTGERPPVAA